MQHRTYQDIITEPDMPAVAIDEQGIFVFVNPAFAECYGWQPDELLGKVITAIIPPHMRDSHNFGFSRFLVSESPRILGTPLTLPVYCKDGRTVPAEHYIIAEKHDGAWRFAATIRPVAHET